MAVWQYIKVRIFEGRVVGIEGATNLSLAEEPTTDHETTALNQLGQSGWEAYGQGEQIEGTTTLTVIRMKRENPKNKG